MGSEGCNHLIVLVFEMGIKDSNHWIVEGSGNLFGSLYVVYGLMLEESFLIQTAASKSTLTPSLWLEESSLGALSWQILMLV